MKKLISFSTAAATVAGAVLFTTAACGDDDRDFDRSQMIQDIGQRTIIETNDELLEASSSLDSTANGFCEEPNEENLEAARQAWLEVKEPLKRMESYSFGPYRTARVAMEADKWPGRADNIEAILGSDDAIDQEYIADLNYEERIKGYPAIEYMLYGAPDDADTLEAYTSEDVDAERRCEYLQALTEHAHGVIGDYHDRWDADGGGYIDEFTSAGAGSDAFPSEQDAVTDLVGTMMFALDEIAGMKLGVPAGLVDESGEGGAGEPAPEDVEAPYSQTSVDHALWTLEGVEALYLGDGEGLALTDYVQFREQTGGVDETVRERLDAARQAIEEIPEPLSETVTENPEAVENAIDRVDELNQALSAEVSTLLGINPTTVEGDND